MEIKLAIGAVTVAVAIIVLAAVLMPVLDDAEVVYDKATFDNPTMYGAEKVTTGSVEMKKADSTMKLNGESWTSTAKIPVFMGNNFLLQMKGSDLSTDMIYYSNSTPIRVDSLKEINMTYADKVINLSYVDSSDNTVTATIPSAWAYAIPNDSESHPYVVYNLYGTSKSVYYHDLKEFAAFGYATSGNDITKVYSAGNGSATINGSNVAIELSGFTEVTGYTQVYSGSISYNTGFGLDDSGTTVYPWWVALPSQVIGYEPSDASYAPILAAIPALIIVAIIVGILAFALRRAND